MTGSESGPRYVTRNIGLGVSRGRFRWYDRPVRTQDHGADELGHQFVQLGRGGDVIQPFSGFLKCLSHGVYELPRPAVVERAKGGATMSFLSNLTADEPRGGDLRAKPLARRSRRHTSRSESADAATRPISVGNHYLLATPVTCDAHAIFHAAWRE